MRRLRRARRDDDAVAVHERRLREHPRRHHPAAEVARQASRASVLCPSPFRRHTTSPSVLTTYSSAPSTVGVLAARRTHRRGGRRRAWPRVPCRSGPSSAITNWPSRRSPIVKMLPAAIATLEKPAPRPLAVQSSAGRLAARRSADRFPWRCRRAAGRAIAASRRRRGPARIWRRPLRGDTDAAASARTRASRGERASDEHANLQGEHYYRSGSRRCSDVIGRVWFGSAWLLSAAALFWSAAPSRATRPGTLPAAREIIDGSSRRPAGRPPSRRSRRCAPRHVDDSRPANVGRVRNDGARGPTSS